MSKHDDDRSTKPRDLAPQVLADVLGGLDAFWMPRAPMSVPSGFGAWESSMRARGLL